MKKYFQVERITSSQIQTQKLEDETQLSESDNEQDQDNEEKQNKTTYTFLHKWLINFQWLEYCIKEPCLDSKMYCKYCISFQLDQRKQYEMRQIRLDQIIVNQFIKGCVRFKLLAIKEHADTMSHKQATNFIQSQNKPPQINIFEAFTRQNIQEELLKPLFISQYFIAKNKIPFENYTELVKMMNYLNIQSTQSYLNRIAGREIFDCIYKNKKKNFLEDIKSINSPISISIDTKCNRFQEQLLAISIKYLAKNFLIQDKFLQISELSQKDAQTIFNELINLLKSYNILHQLVFFTTDGEVTLCSQINGVSGKLNKIIPWMLSIHCQAHCANLGLSDITKQYDIIQRLNKIIFKICTFFNSKKSNNFMILKQQQEEIFLELQDQEELYLQNKFKPKKLQKPLDIRWVSYLPCIERVEDEFNAIIQSLDAINSNKSLKLKQKFLQLDILYYAFLHKEILTELNYFVKDLQSKNLNLVKLKNSYNLCIQGLKQIINNLEKLKKDFINKLDFNGNSLFYSKIKIDYLDKNQVTHQLNSQSKLISEIINKLIISLEERFILIDEIVCLKAFDIQKIKNTDQNLLNDYCTEEVQVILSHYSKYIDQNQMQDESKLSFNNFNLKDAQKEYKMAKQFIYSNKQQTDQFLIMQIFELDRFKNIFYFFMINQVLVLTSVEPERIFSTESIIKTKIRNKLKIETLNKLMMVDLNGPPLEEYNFSPSIKLFKELSQNNLV